MKFSLALHMERFSPKDDLRAAADNVLSLVKMADAGGFETVWSPEHHTIECTISPNPFANLIWWAAHTERIRLGTATITAPYWNPIRLAGEAGLCDLLSGGRLELGLARGSYQYEFDRMADGMPQQEGGACLREILPALRGLWAGDYAHEGKYWSFPEVTATPKPLQTPHPPIWVAARDPDTFDWAIRNGCNIMSTPLARPMSEVGILRDKFETALAAHPTVPRPRFLMLRRTCVYDRPEGAEVAVRSSMNYGRYFENLFQNIATVRNGFPEAVDYENVRNRAEYDADSVRANMMFGTPDEIIEKLLPYEAAGVDLFCAGMSFGLPFEAQKKSLQLLIDEVLPVFAARERDRRLAAERRDAELSARRAAGE